MRALPEGEVHVWVVPADAAAAPEVGLLAPDERARAAAFRRPADRLRFEVARATLRRLLSEYAGVAPHDVAYDTTCARCGSAGHGKPRLMGEAAGSGVRFGASRSGGLALLAFARGREVGVDVEALGTHVDPVEVAERFFAPAERAAVLAAREGDERRDVFHDLWARKEALLKLAGVGLAGLEETDAMPRDAHVLALDVGPLHRAALAVEAGASPVVRVLRWGAA